MSSYRVDFHTSTVLHSFTAITISSEISFEAPQFRQKAIILDLGQQTVTQKRKRKFKPEKEGQNKLLFFKGN
jgi:hypothetical protein